MIREVDKNEAIKYTLNTMQEIVKDLETTGHDSLVTELKVLQFAVVTLGTIPDPGILTVFLLKFIIFAFGDQELGANLAQATLNTMDRIIEGRLSNDNTLH